MAQSCRLKLAAPLTWALALAAMVSAQPASASENTPRKPFAEWADVPEPGQFVVTPWYMEGEAYHVWVGSQRRNVNVIEHGENYGIDRMNGMIDLQYGITTKWAADLNLGITTVGSRSFNPNGASQSTTGLMDPYFGVRYQIWRESGTEEGWRPTVSFRAGAILPGSYDKEFPFSPGVHTAAIEPSLLMKKHFGWKGFGASGDVLYRWNRTSGADQYITSVGLFQEIGAWHIDVAYRHLQTLSGSNINPTDYFDNNWPQIREISDSVDAGFSYVTSKRHFRYAFLARKTFDGSNTDSAFWVGAYVDLPFGGK